MIDRVLRAAVTFMFARSSSAGRISSSSDLSADQEARTPMLVSTSRMRLTSSICAMPVSTVRPWLIRDAQSRATAAFLDERTAIEPLSVTGPWMRRCVGPPAPAVISGESSAPAIRLIISRLRFWPPDSIRCTALCEVPSTSASSCWVRPRCLRASRMSVPMLLGRRSATFSTLSHMGYELPARVHGGVIVELRP